MIWAGFHFVWVGSHVRLCWCGHYSEFRFPKNIGGFSLCIGHTSDALPDLDTDLEWSRIEVAWRYDETHLHAEEIVWCKGWVHSMSNKTYRMIKCMLVNIRFDSVDISQGSSVAKFELRRSQWYPTSSHEPCKH